MAERWEEIAKELGTWDLESVDKPGEFYSVDEMVKQEAGWASEGDFTETEPACRRIAALEAEVEVLSSIRRGQAHMLRNLGEERDTLKAEVERLRGALEGIRDEADHIFGSPTPFTSGWLARVRNAARKALGDA